jgi:hypothetical protein
MRYLYAAYAALLTLFLAVAAVGALVVYERRGPSDTLEEVAARNSFNLVAWELKYLPEKWLYKVGDFIKGHGGDDDEDLRAYFAIVDEIRRLEQGGPSPELDAAEEERKRLANRVEDIIEGRVTAILKDEGLTMSPPPFTRLDMVFPPVDFQFDSPPRVLAISPRDRIELTRSDLLTPGLTLADAIGIEHEVEGDRDNVSVLVTTTGGVATYPSVISYLRPYEALIDTVFHEWLHQYLFFFPLGRNYYSSAELRTLNESVANIGGRELAALYFERYGPLHPPPEPAPPTTPSPTPPTSPAPPPEPPFDFTAEMRALRVEVEEMLGRGLVEEAEALMDEKRDEFEAQGRYIRRLNQAYFAFYGFYGDSPASIDPIGPRLQELYERAGAPGAFIRTVAGITSEAQLDDLLGG